jgi:hypothetical protein
VTRWQWCMAGGPMAATKVHCLSLRLLASLNCRRRLWRAWIISGTTIPVPSSSVSRGPKKLAAGKPSHGQTRLGKKLIFLMLLIW